MSERLYPAVLNVREVIPSGGREKCTPSGGRERCTPSGVDAPEVPSGVNVPEVPSGVEGSVHPAVLRVVYTQRCGHSEVIPSGVVTVRLYPAVFGQ